MHIFTKCAAVCGWFVCVVLFLCVRTHNPVLHSPKSSIDFQLLLLIITIDPESITTQDWHRFTLSCHSDIVKEAVYSQSHVVDHYLWVVPAIATH